MEYLFPAEDCINVFCEYMEVKAEDLGLSNNTLFRDPCGIGNVSTARDMLRCLIRANECDMLKAVWGKPTYTAQLGGKNPREFPLVSTVFRSKCSRVLTDEFEVVGGKSGTLTKYGAYNLSVIVKIPDSDDRLACTVMYANTNDCGEQNRFQATVEALRAALAKYRDRSCDVSKMSVCAKSAVVCLVPPLGADEYHAQLDILFEKNAGEILKPASMTKMLTSVIVSEFAKGLSEEVSVTKAVLDLIPSGFFIEDLQPGDVITVEDALHAMMLPSSNATAYVLANHIGHRLLTDMDD